MKLLIINLSPRRQGTSNRVAEYIRDGITELSKAESSVTAVQVEIECLYSHIKTINFLLEKIQNADILVLSGPSYVVSFPAETIALLEKMAETEGVLHGQKLYGFIQGGMPYVHTHVSGLHVLENFAVKEDVCWQGGFVMGGGAMLDGQTLDNLIGAKKMIPAIDCFVDAIYHGQVSKPELYENAGTKLSGFMAFVFSKLLGHMIRKNFRRMRIDFKQKSPYLPD